MRIQSAGGPGKETVHDAERTSKSIANVGLSQVSSSSMLNAKPLRLVRAGFALAAARAWPSTLIRNPRTAISALASAIRGRSAA